jgi:molybdopterin molybdotransferase
MLSVDEALARVLSESRPLAPREIPLNDALGLVLAKNIFSDVDSPPFDKALMDGYAIVASDLAGGDATFEVIEEVAAGATPKKPLASGKATRMMTGAPIPTGADAVVMVERSTPVEEADNCVRLTDKPAKSGQNILHRAASMRVGDNVLEKGRTLRPMEIGLLAEVGQSMILAHPAPRCAVVSTGNELVAVDAVPATGQIRNSNSAMLHAQCLRAGAMPTCLGIALDNEGSLSDHFRRGLDADVLLISGGVSAGRFDLAPQVLESLGATNCFRQVSLKPGKPLWFGYLEHKDRRTLIFGLPGNPASSLVCFELFVAPAIARLKGHAPARRAKHAAMLASSWTNRSDRPTYHPGALTPNAAGEQVATPLNWKGSADLRTLALADCLICFPPGEVTYAAGERVDVILLM